MERNSEKESDTGLRSVVNNRLRGVSFDWKESGKPSVGLIAEEVDRVIPEVVAHGGNSGAATGVNYSALVGVLVEAVKEQQEAMKKQDSCLNIGK